MGLPLFVAVVASADLEGLARVLLIQLALVTTSCRKDRSLLSGVAEPVAVAVTWKMKIAPLEALQSEMIRPCSTLQTCRSKIPE